MSETNPNDPNHTESDGELGGDLSEEIAKKWDPQRLLRFVSKRAGKGSRLDVTTRERYERMLGADFGNVRIYTGQFAEEVTRAHNAEAVTVASTGMILMRGSADMSPLTNAGQGLLAHELTHVAQAQPGMHRKATAGNDMPFTEEHEQEAEQVQAQVAAGENPASQAAAKEGAKEQQEQIAVAVRQRVLEMLAEAERLDEIRNGEPPYRP